MSATNLCLGVFRYRGSSSPLSPPACVPGCANTTGLHTLQWLLITDTCKRPKGAQKPPSRWVKSWGVRMDNAWRMKKQQEEERKEDKGSTYRRQIKHGMQVIGPGWTLDINWQHSSKGMGNAKTSRKESDVAVMLAQPLHASNDGRSKEKGNDQRSNT